MQQAYSKCVLTVCVRRPRRSAERIASTEDADCSDGSSSSSPSPKQSTSDSVQWLWSAILNPGSDGRSSSQIQAEANALAQSLWNKGNAKGAQEVEQMVAMLSRLSGGVAEESSAGASERSGVATTSQPSASHDSSAASTARSNHSMMSPERTLMSPELPAELSSAGGRPTLWLHGSPSSEQRERIAQGEAPIRAERLSGSTYSTTEESGAAHSARSRWDVHESKDARHSSPADPLAETRTRFAKRR